MNISQPNHSIQARGNYRISPLEENIYNMEKNVRLEEKDNEASLHKSTTDSKYFIPMPLPGTTNQTLKELVKEFMNIVKKGNLNEIIEYIDKYSLDVSKIVDDNFRHTPLYYSTLIKDDDASLKVMNFFVDKKINPAYVDILNQTALFYAARENKINCFDIFLNYNCSINHRDQYGQTPLYYAAREGHLEATKKLIQLGAEINNEDNQGQTPIFYAAKQGHSEVCSYLITKGAKINIQDRHKQTPLLMAKKNGKTQVVDLLLALGAAPVPIIPLKEKKNPIIKAKEESSSQKNYVLTVLKEGRWIKVENDEFLQIMEKLPEVAKYLMNPNLLKKVTIPNFPENIPVYENWEKLAMKIMNTLWKFHNSIPFHYPVDPVALNIPDYLDIIKKPMDFSTIKQKLTKSSYLNGEEFINDVELVFANCIEYNCANSDYGLLSKQLSEEFHKLLESTGFSFYICS